METRNIGSLKVSAVGLGCNNFGSRIDAAATEQVVNASLDAGITFFDTADVYGSTRSEEYLGRALGRRRDEVTIASKFGKPVDDERRGAHPRYIARAAEDSLRRLGTDRIDLYQLHEPDPAVPVEDTLGALEELVRAGKVIEIGCSNFSVAELRDAEDASRARGTHCFVSVQNEYSLLEREPERDGVLAECERAGYAFLPYYPLYSGLLTGKYRRGAPAPEGSRVRTTPRYGDLMSDENMARVEALIAFAEARGHTILDLAISWLLAHRPVASVIAGATKAAQVRANVAAAGWQLTADDLAAVDEALSIRGSETTEGSSSPR